MCTLTCRRVAAGPDSTGERSVSIAATVGVSYARIVVGYIESCGSGVRDRERCAEGTIRRARSWACRDAWSTAGTTREALRFVAD